MEEEAALQGTPTSEGSLNWFSELIQFLTENYQIITATGQLVTGVLVAMVAIYVYFYNRRRDKLEFFYNNWNKQQDINLECLSNEHALKAIEALIYEETEVDLDEARKFTLAFLHLNKVQNNFVALNNKIISKKDYRDMSIPTLQLFARQKDLIEYLLRQRGYSREFGDSVVNMMADLEPYDTPKFAVLEDQAAINENEELDAAETETEKS